VVRVREGKEDRMASKEVTIDSVRLSLMSGEWVVILKEKGTEQYLPIYMGPSQANIVKRELIGARFPEPEVYERFLAGVDIAKADLESVTVNGPDKNLFRAKLLLTERGESLEMDCPVAGALALALRRSTRILVDEIAFDKVGITLPE
jgi:bifunctional DNase/RNase